MKNSWFGNIEFSKIQVKQLLNHIGYLWCHLGGLISIMKTSAYAFISGLVKSLIFTCEGKDRLFLLDWRATVRVRVIKLRNSSQNQLVQTPILLYWYGKHTREGTWLSHPTGSNQARVLGLLILNECSCHSPFNEQFAPILPDHIAFSHLPTYPPTRMCACTRLQTHTHTHTYM